MPVVQVTIVLRQYTVADLDRLVALANNKRVSQYLMDTFPHPYTRAAGEWWIAVGSTQNGAMTRVIDYQGQLVGSVAISPQNGWRQHLGEIGYWIGEEHWGKGFATEALAQMTGYGFASRQFDKLYAPVLAPNVASMRVLEKCGYAAEAVLKSEVKKDGRVFDLHRYARHRR